MKISNAIIKILLAECRVGQFAHPVGDLTEHALHSAGNLLHSINYVRNKTIKQPLYLLPYSLERRSGTGCPCHCIFITFESFNNLLDDTYNCCNGDTDRSKRTFQQLSCRLTNWTELPKTVRKRVDEATTFNASKSSCFKSAGDCIFSIYIVFFLNSSAKVLTLFAVYFLEVKEVKKLRLLSFSVLDD